jgi:hypothetical protein
VRAAVERGERLPIEFEGDGEAAALRRVIQTARVFENGEVKVDRLLGVRIEPEKRCDARKFPEALISTGSLSIHDAAESQRGGSVVAGRHQQQLPVLIVTVCLREIPHRSLWLVVAAAA